MKAETKTLVAYRLGRAHESLEEARILLEQGHVNTFVNRLYYACFYAISALLLTKGLFLLTKGSPPAGIVVFGPCFTKTS
ncbi:MAG: HEPN domain-containing protein [Deltaproteobacteria bacterium]|nr:HEPN domain-containing protein [Deltaproteobacteria bacterium]